LKFKLWLEDIMRRNGLIWGIAIILLGGMLLLDNLGLLPRGINVWGIFWPLVLIGLGINALLRATNTTRAHEESLSLGLEDARQAKIKFAHGAGELRVDAGQVGGKLVEGSFVGGVEQHTGRTGDETWVELRVPSGMIPAAFPFDSGHGLDWSVHLTPDIPLRLEFEVGASKNTLNLRGLKVKELRLSTGASATEVTFPERAGTTAAWLKSGAASVEGIIPNGVAARIRARGGLASIEVDSMRFPRTGDEYISPDYATAENRLDLDIETGVGAVTIK
jgi:hypothetical protein